MARPPLALDRLSLREDGKIVYRLKKAWKDGTHAVVLSPQDFIARLCALVPPPRFHLMRYLGVLAGHSSLRAEVVPKKRAALLELPQQLPLFHEADEPTMSAKKTAEPSRHRMKAPPTTKSARRSGADAELAPRLCFSAPSRSVHPWMERLQIRGSNVLRARSETGEGQILTIAPL